MIRNETGIEEWILYKARARIARIKNAKQAVERERQERAAAAEAEHNGQQHSSKKKQLKANSSSNKKALCIAEGSREFHDCFPNPFRVSTFLRIETSPYYSLLTSRHDT